MEMMIHPECQGKVESCVAEIKDRSPYYCQANPDHISCSSGSSTSITPPRSRSRNGVRMSSNYPGADDVGGGTHKAFLRRRWKSLKGSVTRFWTCCVPHATALDEAEDVRARNSASSVVSTATTQSPGTGRGVCYSEMGSEQREMILNEVIAFCTEQSQRPESVEPQNERRVMTEAKSQEIEMEDEIPLLSRFKLKPELMQEEEFSSSGCYANNKNNNNNEKMKKKEKENDTLRSIVEHSESLQPNNMIKKSARRSLRHHFVEESTWELIMKPEEEDECFVGNKKVEQKLKLLGLKLNKIKPDGHCLFRAIEDQLSFHSGRPHRCTYKVLRKMASTYMKENASHFLPFFQCHWGRFDEHCRRVELTDAWGGQLELGALSHCLRKHIVLFSGDFVDLEIGKVYKSGGGSSSSNQSIMLSYHMHSFGFGDHYNSVVPDVIQVDNEAS